MTYEWHARDEKQKMEIERKRGVAHHSGELCITTVSAGLGVSSKTGDLGEIEAELGLEPVYGVS